MSEPLTDADRDDVKSFIAAHWQGPAVCIRGQLYEPHLAEGFVVRRDQRIVALVTYLQQGDRILMLTQNSTDPGSGIGASQVLRVLDVARDRHSRTVWLTTSNANLAALGFYQRMGFRIVAVHCGAIDAARRTLKRQIPEHGPNGLPIRDELELALELQPYT